jgi:hypothetical protein
VQGLRFSEHRLGVLQQNLTDKKNHKEKTIEKGKTHYTSARAMEESKCITEKAKVVCNLPDLFFFLHVNASFGKQALSSQQKKRAPQAGRTDDKAKDS